MPGEHLIKAIEASIRASSYYKEFVYLRFNDVDLVVSSESNVSTIVKEFEDEVEYQRKKYEASTEGIKEKQDHENMLQAQNDKLNQLKENLPDFSNLDSVISWLGELEKSCDCISLSKAGIVEVFEGKGYFAGVNCGEDFKEDDRDNCARWLIGQALECIRDAGAIHPMYHTFAKQWRDKFGE